MDDFSKTILKELLPVEKELPAPPKGKQKRRDDVLDHLSSPVLLERAAYLRKLAKHGDGSAGEVLKEYPQHAIHLLVRSRNGGAELHENFADLFFVIEGHAALVTGGTIADAKTVAPGEIRGSSVEGVSARICGRAMWLMCRPDCRTRCLSQATSSSPAWC